MKTHVDCISSSRIVRLPGLIDVHVREGSVRYSVVCILYGRLSIDSLVIITH